MKSQLTLLIVCMLFYKVLSLTCQQCVPSATGSCTNKQISCSNQCATSTSAVYYGGTMVQDYNIQTCIKQEDCGSGSLNLGSVKLTTNTKCCTTDLCNTETLPVLPRKPLNGRMCYSCDNNVCSGKVSCEGDEDRCISVSDQQAGIAVSMKGCVSKSYCVVSGQSSTSAMGETNMYCCEGNLCNSAESFTQSFLLMLVPLLFSNLFY